MSHEYSSESDVPSEDTGDKLEVFLDELSNSTVDSDVQKFHQRCIQCTKYKGFVESKVRKGDPDNMSHVTEFYKDKDVFITGGSGFLGQVLIEKLLRCTDIRTVYVLLRAKKGVSPEDRKEVMLSGKAFSRLALEKPNALNKFVIIAGDICLPGLGISESDRNLINEVSVVFHSAATIKLHEPLRVAVEMNVIGTRKVLSLCKELPLLQAFVHVSTSYTNCYLNEYSEVIIQSKAPFDVVLNLLDNIKDDDYISQLTGSLLENRPNTYGYTKALAEQLLLKEGEGVPIGIARPSIVMGAISEPFPGWVIGATGPTGMLTLVYAGIIRNAQIVDEAIVDFVPVDYVINHLLSIAWITGKTRPIKPKVYVLSSGCLNPISMRSSFDIALKTIYSYPCKRMYRYPKILTTKHSKIIKLFNFFDHYLPAVGFDLMLKLRGKKPRLVRMYDKVQKELQSLDYFFLNDFKFHCHNTISLLGQMSAIDREIYDFDVTKLNWPEYTEQCMLGIREFLLKEDKSTIPEGQKALRIAFITQKGVELIGIFFLAKILFMLLDYFAIWGF